jgi:hypothetical protein
MDVRGMDGLSDWDDWSDDPEWWLRHPLHRPRRLRAVPACSYPGKYPQKAKKITVA